MHTHASGLPPTAMPVRHCQTPCVVCDPSYPPLSHPGGSFAIRSTHFEIAMAAVERGLHVMVTKPAVKTLADHIKLVEAAKAKGGAHRPSALCLGGSACPP